MPMLDAVERDGVVYLRVPRPAPIGGSSDRLAWQLIDACARVEQRDPPLAAVALVSGGDTFCVAVPEGGVDCDRVGEIWAQATAAIGQLGPPTIAVIEGGYRSRLGAHPRLRSAGHEHSGAAGQSGGALGAHPGGGRHAATNPDRRARDGAPPLAARGDARGIRRSGERARASSRPGRTPGGVPGHAPAGCARGAGVCQGNRPSVRAPGARRRIAARSRPGGAPADDGRPGEGLTAFLERRPARFKAR